MKSLSAIERNDFPLRLLTRLIHWGLFKQWSKPPDVVLQIRHLNTNYGPSIVRWILLRQVCFISTRVILLLSLEIHPSEGVW